MPETFSTRPLLESTLSGKELLRWYWLKNELIEFGRSLGLSSGGSKELLTARIAAHLDGTEFSEPEVKREVGPHQLDSVLLATSIIPRGQ